ncbi:MAG: L,D-transpeptidase [Desmonostoc vinosum HA7617-LM4]|jgi:lipoprotein-anchoring transpeptidase ErfK/SrfK|nr:L,D-transpeptidase [Desmonostoc vinosum HA7617-LM4]
MVRNESVARMVMLLCFGTAILSLAVHWRITTAAEQLEKPASASPPRDSTPSKSQQSRPQGVYRNTSQASSQKAAIDVSALPSQPTQNSVAKQHSQPKLSARRNADVEKISKKKIAKTTDRPNKTGLVVSEATQKPITNDQPLFLLSQASEPQKLTDRLAAQQTQVVVDLSDRRAYVYARDEVIASYPLAIGKKGWETPTGSFKIRHMQYHPIWRHPITGKVFEAGTDSPLGDRWIGFWTDGRNHIGFHGTPDTEVMGSAVSHGCLRMRNPDVRVLYEQVKIGTEVVVRD